MNKFKLYVVILAVLSSCAIQQPPTGGPPDKTPPVITETFPKNQTLNFKRDYVQFRFSKYMNKSSVIENMFVSPNKQTDYDWSGKDLEISFKEPMDSNTTYSITLGTDYTDLKGNKPETSYSLIFSTGSKIDSGSIKGVLMNKKSEGVYIFAYNLEGINPDTLDPRHTKANYKTQVGSRSTFEIVALKPGRYRLLAINDVYKDGLYDEGIDDFGTTLSDPVVGIMPVEDIRLKTGPANEAKGPALYTAEAVSANHLILEFSKSLDTSTVNKNNFRIDDSVSSRKIDIKSAFLSNGFASKVDIYTQQQLDTSIKWKIYCNNDNTTGIRDSSGNAIVDTNSSARFAGNSEIEKFSTKMTNASIKDSSLNVSVTGIIDLIFSNTVENLFDNSNVSMKQSAGNESIQFKLFYPQENILRITPSKNLNPDTWYKLTFDSKFKTDDSIIILNFKTIETRNNGSLNCKIIDSSGYTGQYIVTLYAKETADKYRLVTNSHEFGFESVIPGAYILEISSDSNGNGKYDYGNAYPWKPSEKILVIPQDIIIKPKWKIDDYLINYNGK